MKRLGVTVTFALLSCVSSVGSHAKQEFKAEQVVKITVVPQQVYIERGEMSQYLNFDFLVENLTDRKLRLDTIQVSVLDQEGRLVLRRFVNQNGLSPSIYTIPKIDIEEKGSLFIFNPFYSFDRTLHLKKLHYEFLFDSESGGSRYKSEVGVSPLAYETKTDLILPLKGRLIVYDGHDFYAHHRRIDLTHPVARQIGIRTNRGRYAYDLCVVNEKGDLYRGEGDKKEDWFGFKVAVYAPGDGKVAVVVDHIPDNTLDGNRVAYPEGISFPESFLKTPNLFAGNYVVIDHRNGEYSMIAHLKQGSAKVREGDEVKQGQPIAQMGFSGSTGWWVHIHYELGNGKDLWNSEGLPSYFRDFRRLLGSRPVKVKRGQIDTGDIVESLASR